MVDAVVYYRVVDPEKATLAVENYEAAVKDRAKVVLRDVVGETRLDDLLAHREEVAAKVRAQVEKVVAPVGPARRADRPAGRAAPAADAGGARQGGDRRARPASTWSSRARPTSRARRTSPRPRAILRGVARRDGAAALRGAREPHPGGNTQGDLRPRQALRRRAPHGRRDGRGGARDGARERARSTGAGGAAERVAEGVPRRSRRRRRRRVEAEADSRASAPRRQDPVIPAPAALRAGAAALLEARARRARRGGGGGGRVLAREPWSMGTRAVTAHRVALVVDAPTFVALGADAARAAAVRQGLRGGDALAGDRASNIVVVLRLSGDRRPRGGALSASRPRSPAHPRPRSQLQIRGRARVLKAKRTSARRLLASAELEVAEVPRAHQARCSATWRGSAARALPPPTTTPMMAGSVSATRSTTPHSRADAPHAPQWGSASTPVRVGAGERGRLGLPALLPVRGGFTFPHASGVRCRRRRAASRRPPPTRIAGDR